MSGTLYLLPTILGDADPEATGHLSYVIPADVQRLTAQLGYLIAENAKTTRAYLKLVSTTHALARPLQEIRIAELNVRSSTETLPALLKPILDGENGGLISEAGVPAVADPGARLVRLAHQHGITVRPLVGPSSLLLAVMASGLNGQQFAFNGYLPTEPAHRSERIKALEKRSHADQQTQLFIETPYRNGAMLEALVATCRADTLICVATDLTLASETIATHSAQHWKSLISSGKMPDFHKKPTVFLFLAA